MLCLPKKEGPWAGFGSLIVSTQKCTRSVLSLINHAGNLHGCVVSSHAGDTTTQHQTPPAKPINAFWLAGISLEQ
jgi:hypothetical protein